MTIPTLMSILGAPGSPAAATSAVAGAELPGSGQVGFACLVQMLLDQQQAPTTTVADDGADDADDGADGADGEPTTPGAAPVGGAPAGVAAEAAAPSVVPSGAPVGAAVDTSPGERAGVPAAGATGLPTTMGAEESADGVAPAANVSRRGRGGEVDRPSMGSQEQDPPALVAAMTPGTPTAQGIRSATDTEGGETPPSVSGTSVRAATGAARQDADVAAHGVVDAAGSAESAGSVRSDGDASTGPARSAAATTPAPAAEPGQTQSQTQSQTQPVAVGMTAPTAGGTHTANPAATTAAPVPGQVFPEVVRLVTRGDGTQRLTLRLTPENLGEVRIVVTVRDGGVEVRLAAGTEAQDALRHGSADLRRLLESVGATSTQIVVRDLHGGSTSALGTSAGPGSPVQPPGTGAAATYADGQGGHARDHQRGGDASGDRLGRHQTSGPAHNGVRPEPATTTAAAAAAGVDLRL